MRIVTVGSINMDVVNRVEKHPMPGETIRGKGTQYIPGGKGANQAIAAAKAGGDVFMVGAVGSDGFGTQLRNSLNVEGINTEYVFTKECTSGLAFITVNAHGENNIILSEGANGELSASDVENALSVLNADVVLLQNEIPMEITYKAIKIARNQGARVFYNPAPAYKLSNELISNVDVLILNETEASIVLNQELSSQNDFAQAAKRLVSTGAKSVILTLGSDGAVYTDGLQTIRMKAFSVEAIDTTAAGDTFIGVFSTVFNGTNAMKALQFAAAGSAISVTRSGAQVSIPTRQEIEIFLKERQIY
jgi:ribokinase